MTFDVLVRRILDAHIYIYIFNVRVYNVVVIYLPLVSNVKQYKIHFYQNAFITIPFLFF